MTSKTEQVKQSRWQSQETLEWLMEGDPAVRWQVMRDLLDEDETRWNRERQKTAQEGWGASYLSYQDEKGMWGGGIYTPKWISTTYTMLTLRRIGLPSENEQVRKGCRQLLERGRYADGGINFWASQVISEACVTGMVLSILAFFREADPYLDEMADHLLQRQMADGGWNCNDHKGDTHSSFHTTLSVLDGLLEYQKSKPAVRLEIEAARLRGHEFLLQHRLYKSHRTGEVVSPRMTRMPYPPRWFYDFLKALDYFQDYYRWRTNLYLEFPDQESEAYDREHDHDERFSDAIELLNKKEKSSGRWNMMRGPSGLIYFNMEKAGQASRWNTLRALRVLRWWEGER